MNYHTHPENADWLGGNALPVNDVSNSPFSVAFSTPTYLDVSVSDDESGLESVVFSADANINVQINTHGSAPPTGVVVDIP